MNPNNDLPGCHVSDYAAALQSATHLMARIGAWNSEANPTGTLYFDHVYITPAR